MIPESGQLVPATKIKANAKTVIEYLNLKTNSTFKAEAKINKSLVNARLNDGYSIDDLKAIIDHKSKEWDSDHMRQYLRPATLFATTKIDGYLSMAKKRPTNKMYELLKDDWDDVPAKGHIQ